MKKYFLLLLTVFILGGCKQQALTPAQKMKQAHAQAENIEKIRLPDFTFYANTVTPQFGTDISIGTADAYMQVSKNSINAVLPYLGHFYTRPVSRMELPLRFTSTKFVYTVTYDKQADAYDITISPQDVYNVMNDNMIIRMKMDKDGTGTLSIKTDNRDAISYKGNYQ